MERTVCRFYRAGHCKFGANCKFSHDPENRPRLEDVVRADLQVRPQWPLSCYGLPMQPANIIHGDVSPEEARLEAYSQLILHGHIEAYKEGVLRASLEKAAAINQALSTSAVPNGQHPNGNQSMGPQ